MEKYKVCKDLWTILATFRKILETLVGDFWDTNKRMRLGSCLRRSLGMLRELGRTGKPYIVAPA